MPARPRPHQSCHCSKQPDFFYNFQWQITTVQGLNHNFVPAVNYAADLSANKPLRREPLVAADSAFARVNKLAPEYEGAYLYRARVNKQLDNLDNKDALKGLMVPFYEQYVELVTVKKPDQAVNSKAGLIEAYNNLGSYAALTDVAKAKEYFNKTLVLDPTNAYASQSVKALK